MHAAGVHHGRQEVDGLTTDLITHVVTNCRCFQCQIFLCFLYWSDLRFSHNLVDGDIGLLTCNRFGFLFLKRLLFFLHCFLGVFFARLLCIFGSFLFPALLLELLLILEPIELSFGDESSYFDGIVPVVELLGLLDL